MPKKASEFPKRNELVIGTVVRVNPYSAYVTLEEYGNKEGMIHISEVARKWIKDVREVIKQGQKIVALVLDVDEEKNHIALSIKRVSRTDSEEKMKEYKREQKAEKMLVAVAKEMGVDVNDAYKEVGFKIQEEFGELFKAFQMTLTPQGYDLLIRKGIPEKWAKALRSVAKKQMELKETNIKGFLELRSLKPDGINVIKKVLLEAEKEHGLEIKYISAPKYMIVLKSKKAKEGERMLKNIGEKIIENFKKMGGEASFKVD